MSQQPLKYKNLTLIWQNLTVTVDSKTILDNVSGYCQSGQMLAIMGPSGAGKTTLLSLLASKISKSLNVTGSVLANNLSFTAQQFYNFGGYIFQNDILHANLTVKQTLSFVVKLQIKDDKLATQKIQQMITTFQLQKCQNTFIGGQFTKGISGGQKKRVCIAIQMISDPDLLILDEPTSGLDSHKVRGVIKILKKLAFEKKKTIIFTLHQPSFLIYKQLNRLVLLNKGKIVYEGLSCQIYEYMRQKLKITVPLNCNISDFFMMEISEYKQKRQGYKSPLNYENFCLYLQDELKINTMGAKNAIQLIGYEKLQTSNSFIEQFSLLLKREWILFLRNKLKGLRLILISLLIVITSGLIFLNAIKENRPRQNQLIQYKQLQAYLIKAQGTSYIAVLSCIMSNVNTVALNFPIDKQIYYKESSSKKYRSVSYIISKIITQVCLCSIGAMIVGIGQYLMVGYTLVIQQFVKYILALMICCMVGNSLGFLVGTLFKEAKIASALTPLLLMPLMIFSGMYTRLDSLAGWIGWIQYISPFKYGLHALLVNQFHDEKYQVKKGLFNFTYDYRKDLQISLDYWENIIVLLGLIGLFYSISFVLLKKISSNLVP